MKRIPTLLCVLACLTAAAQGRYTATLSGEGWKLWYDAEADWSNETPVRTPVDVDTLPVHAPTAGWDAIVSAQAVDARVPGTVEEFLQTVPGPEGDLQGVGWWSRTVAIPPFRPGSRVVLQFEAIRHRAEIFIDRRLAGYEIVGNTPFEVDITRFVRPGTTVQLAVRITDPGGNHDWRDSSTFEWNGVHFPMSHAFGGITGDLTLEVRDAVAVSDLYMRNQPSLTEVDACVTIENTGSRPLRRDLRLSVREADGTGREVWSETLSDRTFSPGEQLVERRISLPDARLWSPDTPALYRCEATLVERGRVTDGASRRFGFRWFDIADDGDDARFVLNGRRIVLRSAISWGFWPANGIFPTDELARRQVSIAKELGLNMLNFHRAVGQTNVLDYADELGLLYYEEPGAYKTGAKSPFTQWLLREKSLRMVRRDRSHPSLVIYNMMNETADAPEETLREQLRDMRDMHALDPGRIITRTSAWSTGDDVEDQSKIHLRPCDTTVYRSGWYDFHHAGGPATWQQELYHSPESYYNRTTNRREIVMFGEEGAISAPPRLERDRHDIERMSHKGWDCGGYLAWYDDMSRFLDEKGLRGLFPTVDDFTRSLGSISYEHQGRKIQLARIDDATDAYVVNGWEAELVENHSGIVDCFRLPKSDPELIARYNRPLYVAVMPRQQIAAAGGEAIADFYIVNEKNIHGDHTLRIEVTGPDGRLLLRTEREVTVTGGDRYGELLVRDLALRLPDEGGFCTIRALLLDPNGVEITDGEERILVVQDDVPLPGHGAAADGRGALREWLGTRAAQPVAEYADTLGRLDWVVLTTPPTFNALSAIPTDAMTAPDGTPGAEVSYYLDQKFRALAHRGVEPLISKSVVGGETPHPAVSTISDYSIVWRTTLTPPISGEYILSYLCLSTKFTVLLDGEVVCDKSHKKTPVRLEAGRSYDLEVRYVHSRGSFKGVMTWIAPVADHPDPQGLLDRVRRDGTTLCILDNTASWIPLLEAASDVRFGEEFLVGSAWLGGELFNVPHPIFEGLPAGGAMDWPYQAVVRNGNDRTAYVMTGERLLAGAYHCYPMRLGTAVAEIPMGKGRVIVSTLDLYDNLFSDDTAALTARRIVSNMIRYAAGQ